MNTNPQKIRLFIVNESVCFTLCNTWVKNKRLKTVTVNINGSLWKNYYWVIPWYSLKYFKEPFKIPFGDQLVPWYYSNMVLPSYTLKNVLGCLATTALKKHKQRQADGESLRIRNKKKTNTLIVMRFLIASGELCFYKLVFSFTVAKFSLNLINCINICSHARIKYLPLLKCLIVKQT